MVKNHIKRIVAPVTWPINKKDFVFIAKPNPGAHPLEKGVTLISFFKEFIGVCKTTKEVNNVINFKKVSVNGKQVKDKNYCVGLYDVVKVEATNDLYRIVFDNKGKLAVRHIDGKDADIRPCKIIGKSLMKGKKLQINCSDGTNIIVAKDDYDIADTLVVEMPKIKVKEHIKFEKGVYVQIVDGRYRGLLGEIVDVIRYASSANEDLITFKTEDGREISTLKRYGFVLGKKNRLFP